MSLKVCRICGDNKDLKNILEQGPEMIEKLNKCANIQIYIEDLLPKLICQQCDANLELSYRLRKQSDATQRRLRRELKIQQMLQEYGEQETVLRNREEHTCDDAFKEEEHLEVADITNRFQSVPLPIASDALGGFHNKTISGTSDILDEEEFIAIDNESSTASAAVLVDDESSESFKDIGSRNGSINETFQDEEVIEHFSIDLVTSSEYTSDECEEEYTINDPIHNDNNSSYTCITCQQKFSTKSEYGKHIKQHGTQRFQCIQCCKFFPTRFRLARHEETHMEVPLQQCEYCQRGYRSIYNLERHVKSAHTSSKKFSCDICYLSFSRVDVLKRHMLLHSDKKNYACTICSQSFKIKDYLYSHRKTHHPSESSENLNFTTKTRSKREEKSNKYVCGNCGKEFKTSSSYKNHLLIHTNDKPHECETCNKKFRTIAALMTHQRIHSDYRPYQCDICLKSFKQTSHLKEHKVLHLGATAQHICSICHATFLKKGNLNAHMRTHTKDKPFKCAACSSAFAFMYLLKRHANLIHGRIVDDCGTTSENLNDNNIDITEDTTESEQYDYIDTVTEHDYQEDDRDNVEVFADNQVVYPSSTKLVQTNTIYSIPPEKENSVVTIDDPVLTHIHIDTSNFINSVESDFIENITEEEIHITEQNVEVFVNEETKFTTFYNMEMKVQAIKLEKILTGVDATPGVSEEWSSGLKGTNFIVEIEETASASTENTNYINTREDVSSTATINVTNIITQGPKIIVRTEEVLIVGLVLMLWVGAIVLFFNRWGKIRMLEPYQPKFQQQHRASCPLSDIDPIPHQRSSVSRMSMGFVNNMPSCQFGAYNPTIHSKGYSAYSRSRQNSVFVGPSPNQFLMPKAPRKTRSAMDLHSMILDETAEQV